MLLYNVNCVDWLILSTKLVATATSFEGSKNELTIVHVVS